MATASGLPVLNVKALQVVDDMGNVRIQLACAPNGQAQISLRGPDGSMRLGITVDQDNLASILLRDRNVNRVQLLVSDLSAATAGIILLDAAGKPRLRINFSSTAQPEIAFLDTAEIHRLALATMPGGKPHVVLMGDDGRLKVDLSEDGFSKP